MGRVSVALRRCQAHLSVRCLRAATTRRTGSPAGSRAMRGSAPASAALRRGRSARARFGRDFDRARKPLELARMLGGLKGPIMKVAQLAATVPDVLPPEYAFELQKLQAEAPPMGWAFVRRRMRAELGPDWQKRFKSFEHEPAAAASLGQVHRAVAPRRHRGRLQAAISGHAIGGRSRSWPARRDPRRAAALQPGDRHARGPEGARRAAARGARLRARGAPHAALYGDARRRAADVRVPRLLPDLSTRRLLTMTLARRRAAALASSIARLRSATASRPRSSRPGGGRSRTTASSTATRISATTRSFRKDGEPAGLNLLDYGCIRIFPPSFVEGVIALYRGFQNDDRDANRRGLSRSGAFAI